MTQLKPNESSERDIQINVVFGTAFHRLLDLAQCSITHQDLGNIGFHFMSAFQNQIMSTILHYNSAEM